jgi:hypothetical protein
VPDLGRVPEGVPGLARVDAPAEIRLELEVQASAAADLPVDLAEPKARVRNSAAASASS